MYAGTDSTRPTRRELIRSAGLAVAALAVRPTLAGAPPGQEPLQRQRVLRIAHLTDIHVQPERKADQGLAACLRHVQNLKDKPEILLTGGDTVMDSFATDEARTRLQWELWQKVIKNECSLPVESCLGNHDVWGWNKKASRTDGSEPLWGKKWALEVFDVSRPYRSFNRAGWHFVILDSTFPEGDGYVARLDDEQFEWLAADLAGVEAHTPMLVMSHMPILAPSAFLCGEREKSGDWVVPRSYMHIDARRIKDLFLKHPKVKVCLSGHLHLVDRAEYAGVTYYCNGAVSGAWWRGDHYECQPGYAAIDLFDDGTSERRYVTYGWKTPEG